MQISYQLDCSTDEFRLKNSAAQRQFRDLCDNYTVYRNNRRDSVLTDSRRAGLRGIRVQTKDGSFDLYGNVAYGEGRGSSI